MADENSNQNRFRLSLLREQLKAPSLDVRGIQDLRPTMVERGLIFQNLISNNPENSEVVNLKKEQTSKSFNNSNQVAEERMRKQKQIDNQELPKQQTIWRSDIPFMKNVYRNFIVQKLGSIPLALILGWVHQESSGQLGKEMRNNLDEIGWFQISIDERRLYLNLSSAESRNKLLSDPDFSAKMGLKLIHYYQRYLENNFNITESSPAVWQLVRLSHQRGIGTVKNLMNSMLGNVLDPSITSWEDIKLFVARHPQKKLPLSEISKVDYGIIRGQAIENYLKQFQAR